MNLEVGQTYTTRAGNRVQIISQWSPSFPCPFVGRRLDGPNAGTKSFWAADGHCDYDPSPEDLTATVEA